MPAATTWASQRCLSLPSPTTITRSCGAIRRKAGICASRKSMPFLATRRHTVSSTGVSGATPHSLRTAARVTRARGEPLRVDTTGQHSHFGGAHSDLVQHPTRVHAVGQDHPVGAHASLHQGLASPAEHRLEPFGRIASPIPVMQSRLECGMADDAAADAIGIGNPRPLHVVAGRTADHRDAEGRADQPVIHVGRVDQRHA